MKKFNIVGITGIVSQVWAKDEVQALSEAYKKFPNWKLKVVEA